MSKECIQNCPVINDAVENMNPDLHPDQATAAILRACEASYTCDGPSTTAVEVMKGYFKKRSEIELVTECGLLSADS